MDRRQLPMQSCEDPALRCREAGKSRVKIQLSCRSRSAHSHRKTWMDDQNLYGRRRQSVRISGVIFTRCAIFDSRPDAAKSYDTPMTGRRQPRRLRSASADFRDYVVRTGKAPIDTRRSEQTFICRPADFLCLGAAGMAQDRSKLPRSSGLSTTREPLPAGGFFAPARLLLSAQALRAPRPVRRPVAGESKHH